MLGIADQATKHSLVYPMKERSEAFFYLKDFIEAKFKIYGQSETHYHAHGEKVLINKAVIHLLKSIRSTLIRSSADIPELYRV